MQVIHGVSESKAAPTPVGQAEAARSEQATALRVLAHPAFVARHKNPYTWLIYTHMVNLGAKVEEFSIRHVLQKSYDIFHIHWPERHLNEKKTISAALKTLVSMALILYARLRGAKIVWTVHNLAAHEQRYPRMEALFWKVFTRQLGGFISLSQVGLEAARDRFPQLRQTPGFVIPHIHYRGAYPDQVSREAARAQLGIPENAKVLLFFGRVRPYKNVPELAQVFRQVQDPDALLYVVGRPDFPSLVDAVEAEAAVDPRIKTKWDFVPTEETQLYFRAADLAVLPYSEILNSGIALLSLSFDCPVLVPGLGSLGELGAQVGRDWVQIYEGDLTAAILEQAVDWAINAPRSEQAPLEAYDWKYLAQQTLDAYQAIAHHPNNR